MSVICKIIPNLSSSTFGRISAALSSSNANRSYFTYTRELSQPIENKTPEIMSACEAVSKCLDSSK